MSLGIAKISVLVCFLTAVSSALGQTTEPAGAPGDAAAEKKPSPAKPKLPTPTIPQTCLYADKLYSIGSVICLSGKLFMVCALPDKDHGAPFWTAGEQSLCTDPQFIPR
jgi:hypothetical protein